MSKKVWGRGTAPGQALVRSDRRHGVFAKILEEEDQLLKALARHHRLHMNALLAWALVAFNAREPVNQTRPANLGVGLDRPKGWVGCNQKLSRDEARLWRELGKRYGSLRRAAVMALIELYHSEPVDLRLGLYKKEDDQYDPEEGGPESEAA